MKAIIDGKRYNTETATQIANWSNGFSYTDFNHCVETLYQTKSGAYFLHGEGGALTSYAESHGDSRGGGERIIPYTEKEAYDWCEERQELPAIEEHFSNAVVDA